MSTLWFWLALIPIEALNYHAQAKTLSRLVWVVGNKIKYNFLYKLSLEMNLLIMFFRLLAYRAFHTFGLRMRSDEISGGKASLVQAHQTYTNISIFRSAPNSRTYFNCIGWRVNDVTIWSQRLSRR